MIRRYHTVTADVLCRHTYVIDTSSMSEAIHRVESGDEEPIKVEFATSPIVTSVTLETEELPDND